MRKSKRCASLLIASLLCVGSVQAQHQYLVNTKPGAPIQPTMYGIFFEDINFGADGGLYAELVENRSFEAPLHIKPSGERVSGGLQGWNVFGNVEIRKDKPAFDRNPNYVTLNDDGHREKQTGIENHGYFGMGMKKGLDYRFSVYARTRGGQKAKIRVELVGSDNEVMTRKSIDVNGSEWKKYSAELTSPRTDAKAFMRVYLEGATSVDLDHVSLFPGDAWNGLLRADLVQDLKDLHPGVFRFPGGCIVEGTDLASRYQWKESVGPVENRQMNENRWNYTFPHRLFPNYFQSYGLGFYEFFLLSEYLGSEALPVLSVGLSCQFQNDDKDAARVHVAVDNLQSYIEDALDLIEFANGDVTTKWGKLHADMGHPVPFNLKLIGVGNEQWGPLYPERLEKFVTAIRAKYPNIKIVGSSGPSPDDKDGKQFTYGWEQMTRLKADLVDEHFYRDQDWFMENVTRYDNYSRKGPKVFAGEYACHVKEKALPTPEGKNVFEAALAEAAVMTGYERNADVVHMATYAPLFAHVEGWQWRPDLIWYDNLRSMRTVSWHVQQLYGQYKGENVLKLTMDGKAVTGAEGQNGLFASAVKDGDLVYVKVANTSEQDQSLALNFNEESGLKAVKRIDLKSEELYEDNTLDNPDAIVPVEASFTGNGKSIKAEVSALSFTIFVLSR